MKIPPGIRIIAILQIVGSLFFLVAAMLATNIVLRKEPVGTALVLGSNRPEQVMAGMRAFAGILFAWSIFCAFAGYGLWKRRVWARALTIVQAVLWMTVGVVMLLPPRGAAHLFTFIAVVIFTAVNIAFVWYFERPDVKAAFKRRDLEKI